MILVTGGAGFIGSNLHAALASRGEPCVIADRLGASGKWRNLARHPPTRIVRPEALDAYLADRPKVRAVVPLGAVSRTTATDGDLVWETNVEFSWRLWRWCAANGARFLYASSASTYGDGQHGFDDDPARLADLRPLNLYGWSKHAFDLRVAEAVRAGEEVPPQWAGLKFFNVYGPNEYHKGSMVSVVKRKFEEVSAGSPLSLFRSVHAGIPDGGQKRDFVWVGDVVDVILWLLDHPEVNGVYNIGTGDARSYLDMAHAVAASAGATAAQVEFVPMPEALRDQYQSFTQAETGRLRAAGYAAPFTTLEDGIRRYVQCHLAGPEPYV